MSGTFDLPRNRALHEEVTRTHNVTFLPNLTLLKLGSFNTESRRIVRILPQPHEQSDIRGIPAIAGRLVAMTVSSRQCKSVSNETCSGIVLVGAWHRLLMYK